MIVITVVIFADYSRGYGKVLTAMQGRIYSKRTRVVSYYRPGLFYENNLDCLWTIIGKKNNIILLKFIRMSLENAARCQYDYISVSKTLDFRTYAKY